MELGRQVASPAWSIRPARADDYAAIEGVWSTAELPYRSGMRDSLAGFQRQLERFGDLYLVAVDGERVVGVVFGTHDERKGWINRLAVLPGYRRQGMAASLVSACDKAIRACGIEIVAALIEPENTVSARLFKRLGYKDDVPARYYRKLSHGEA